MASKRRLALLSLALSVVAVGPIVPACANLGVPSACLQVCEGASEGEPCQQCLAKEEQKREEERQKRAEARRQSPSSGYSGGAPTGGGY